MGPFKIAIIGAGPAGCNLVRLLYIASIPFTIFESDESPDARGQGGTLDLRTDTGLFAIRACGLYEEFLKYARFDGESLLIGDKFLTKYVSVQAGSSVGGARPEIDRAELRSLLRGSLPDDAIVWGYDLVVGADGGWSKTRRLVSDELPFYTGISGAEFSILDIAKTHPDLCNLLNKGSVFIFSDNKALMAQQMGDGSLKVGEWGVREESWVLENPIDSPSAKIQLKRKIMAEYSSWALPLQTLLEAASPETLVTRPLFMLPIGYRWKHKRGVTLIGNAARLMSPFAGEGAHLSMEDAVQLASFISKSSSKEELYKNVHLYEDDMYRRARGSQERSFGNMKDMIILKVLEYSQQNSPIQTPIKHDVLKEEKEEKTPNATQCASRFSGALMNQYQRVPEK
ncbi:tetracycline resistance protein from transposon [Phlyctema vagabunda]|uniref:Tetracycline resistance protein from transposon n=1 Tax=Phlyctema vagabunda TaxID=108571 RepID=A0ABR4PGF4_9HELO